MKYGWRITRAWCIGLALVLTLYSIKRLGIWQGHGLDSFTKDELAFLPEAALLLALFASRFTVPRSLFPRLRGDSPVRNTIGLSAFAIGVFALILGGPPLYRLTHDRVTGLVSAVTIERLSIYQEFKKYNEQGEVVEQAYHKQSDKGGWVIQHVIKRPDGKVMLIGRRDLPPHRKWKMSANALHKIKDLGLICLPGLILLILPVWAVYLAENIRENPGFRRLFLSGRGGSSRWAGPATYRKYSTR